VVAVEAELWEWPGRVCGGGDGGALGVVDEGRDRGVVVDEVLEVAGGLGLGGVAACAVVDQWRSVGAHVTGYPCSRR
jgi:hypothetical protein